MGLEDIKEIKECYTQDEVNKTLRQPNWRLIDVKVEKVRVPIGKEKVGLDMCSGFWQSGQAARFEIKYEEKLASLYIAGRYQ